MKKLLLLSIFSLFFAQIKSMEEDANKFLCEEDCQDSQAIQTQAINSGLFGVPLSNEIAEKIFTYANHMSAKEIIDHLSKIIDEKKIFLVRDEFRYFNNADFDEMANIIADASIHTYTRIALFISLNNNFSAYEKLHFFSIMWLKKSLTAKQRIILSFLAKQIPNYKYRVTIGSTIIKEPTKISEFMLQGLYLPDSDSAEIVVKFLFNNGATMPAQALLSLISSANHDINFLRWILKKSGSDNLEISIEYIENALATVMNRNTEKNEMEYQYYQNLIDCLKSYML